LASKPDRGRKLPVRRPTKKFWQHELLADLLLSKVGWGKTFPLSGLPQSQLETRFRVGNYSIFVSGMMRGNLSRFGRRKREESD
jgi:hypothetical protein